jgi:hypothetical protein
LFLVFACGACRPYAPRDRQQTVGESLLPRRIAGFVLSSKQFALLERFLRDEMYWRGVLLKKNAAWSD